MNAQPCAVLDCNKITQPGHVLCPIHEPEVTPGAGTMVIPNPEGGVQRGDPRPRPVEPQDLHLVPREATYGTNVATGSMPTALPQNPLQFLAEAMQGQHGAFKQLVANAIVQAAADAVRKL